MNHQWRMVVGMAAMLVVVAVAVAVGQQRTAGAAGERGLVEIPVEELSLLPRVAAAFDSVAAKRVDDAMAVFEEHAWSRNDGVSRELRSALQMLSDRGGEYTGTELVAVRRVSPRLTELYTFSWFERGPVLFRARFYRRDEQWKFYNFSLTTEVDEFIEATPRTHVWQYERP